jgi:hypothetical protein
MRLEYSFDKYMNSRFYVSFVASMWWKTLKLFIWKT